MMNPKAPGEVFVRAVCLSDAFPGFHYDSLEGELARMRFKRALRRYAPGLESSVYERAIKRATDVAIARERAA